MISPNSEIPEDGIHNYSRQVMCCKKRLEKTEQGDVGISFLEKLHLNGLEDGRIIVYGARLSLILSLFNSKGVKIAKATKEDCEKILFAILNTKTNKGRHYSGESKCAFALALLRLVHHAKTGEIGNREEGYVEEVSWIKPSRFRNRDDEIEILPEDLLTPKELYGIIAKSRNEKEKAMLWVMFEGAFRPGELLNLRVGGIEFKDNYILVSTIGKTGKKRVPLVYSFKPLLEWLAKHPQRDEPKAYLWYSHSSKQKRASYRYLRKILKRCAKDAAIKKRVWNYLIRHTQLTMLAKKLSDQTLCVFGNWSKGSRMPARYVHLSGKDVEDALLELHGIKPKNENETNVKLKTCPRCAEQNTPDSHRCSSCGFILDEQLLANTAESDYTVLQDMLMRLQRLEKSGDSIGTSLDDILKQKPVVFSTGDTST
ncbi:MAG: site-specific integrase [Nitrosopumilus sp.]|nr:site-specific integrase [Nitrosopumilus sp.]MDH3736137.1 site-specific integrase [Nitrosopumilus sp.]MDH3822557.1 site-specific integrase [Nitrosopumilus sp.]MDH3833296.1 site-specific integrase [Nitrosopumilus sp.]